MGYWSFTYRLMLGLLGHNGGVVGGGSGNAAYKVLMNQVIDDYYTRIGTTDTALMDGVRAELLRVVDDPIAFECFYNSITYLAWPESEAMAVIPLFDLRTTNVPDDTIIKFNSPTYSSTLGFLGNGVDSTYYLAYSTERMYRIYTTDRITSWFNYTKIPTTTLYMGVLRTTAASFIRTQSGPTATCNTYIGNANTHWDNTTIGTKMLCHGATASGQNQYEGTSDTNEVYNGEAFEGQDYTTPYTVIAGGTGNKPVVPTDLNATSFYYFNLNAYQSVAISGAPNPVNFSDHGIAGFSFFPNRSRAANALIGNILDNIQVLFGRTI